MNVLVELTLDDADARLVIAELYVGARACATSDPERSARIGQLAERIERRWLAAVRSSVLVGKRLTVGDRVVS